MEHSFSWRNLPWWRDLGLSAAFASTLALTLCDCSSSDSGPVGQINNPEAGSEQETDVADSSIEFDEENDVSTQADSPPEHEAESAQASDGEAEAAPQEPTPVGKLSGFDALGLQLREDTLYVAAGPSGLKIVDIKDPAQPKVLGSVEGFGVTYDVRVVGSRAYVAAWEGGLRVFDIADPTSPKEVGKAQTPAFARAVEANATIVFVGTWNGDYVNPDPTHGVVAYDVSQDSPVELGSLPTPGWAGGLALSNTVLYVADGPGGVRVFDVSTPAEMKEIGYAETDVRAYGVTLRGDRLAVADNTGGLILFDVSNPVSPVRRSTLKLPGAAYSVQFDPAGTQLWVAADSGGVHLVEASEPSELSLQFTLKTKRAWGTALSQTHGYVADTASGLVVFAR